MGCCTGPRQERERERVRLKEAGDGREDKGEGEKQVEDGGHRGKAATAGRRGRGRDVQLEVGGQAWRGPEAERGHYLSLCLCGCHGIA